LLLLHIYSSFSYLLYRISLRIRDELQAQKSRDVMKSVDSEGNKKYGSRKELDLLIQDNEEMLEAFEIAEESTAARSCAVTLPSDRRRTRSMMAGVVPTCEVDSRAVEMKEMKEIKKMTEKRAKVKLRELGGGGGAAGWWGEGGGEGEAAGDPELAAKREAFRRTNAPRALAEMGCDYMATFSGNHPRQPPPPPDASSDA